MTSAITKRERIVYERALYKCAYEPFLLIVKLDLV